MRSRLTARLPTGGRVRSRLSTWLVLTAGSLSLVLVLALMVRPPTTGGGAGPGSGPCIVLTGGNPLPASEAQVRNYRLIIAQGRQLRVPPRGIQIALGVTKVESDTLNLASEAVPESTRYPHDRDLARYAPDGVPAGDHTSINMFQQQRWWYPTVKDGMDPVFQTRTFYTRLTAVAGWQSMGFGQAAQAVQRSAFPARYAVQEAWAAATYRKYVSSAGADIVPAVAVEGGVEGGVQTCDHDTTVPVALSGRWANPLTPYPYVLTSPFGNRMDPVLHIWKLHKGQDMGAAGGTPVAAPCDGRVTAAGWDAWGGGNMTTLDCGGRIVIKLMHQSQLIARAGTPVQAGQTVGRVGTTGHSTGDHLHLQVEHAGTPIDPVAFLRDRGVEL